jgi:hypothetical protein
MVVDTDCKSGVQLHNRCSIGHHEHMYRVKFLESGSEDNDFDQWVTYGIQTTTYEPRPGLRYRFRDRGDRIRGRRYIVTAVEIDQEGDDPSTEVARVFLEKID